MKRMNSLALVAAASILSACGGGSFGYDEPAPTAMTPPPSPPPDTTQTNFTAFMRTQFESAPTLEANDPAEVESVDWVFTDDDDESEYDDVLAASM